MITVTIDVDALRGDRTIMETAVERTEKIPAALVEFRRTFDRSRVWVSTRTGVPITALERAENHNEVPSLAHCLALNQWMLDEGAPGGIVEEEAEVGE